MTRFWLVFVALLSFSASAARFEIRDAAQRDLVQFVSDTPLEKITGISNAIQGWVELDPEKLASGIKGEFEVDVRTFETGSSLRNEHLKEKFLNAPEFPTAMFTFTKLISASKPKFTKEQALTIRAEGNLKLRGVNRLQTILMRATYFRASEKNAVRAPGNLLRLSTTFDVGLNEFGIQIPDVLKYRVARFIQLSIDVTGSDGAIPAIISAPLGEPAIPKPIK